MPSEALDAAQLPSRPAPPRSFDATLIRSIDILIAAVALLFFLPLMLCIGLAVVLTNPGPVFFAQRRIGYGGQTFRCFKFRTMVVNAEQRLAEVLRADPEALAEWARDHKLKNDPRITMIGGFLRKSSLDELPQLINVLRGEMSLVGPRPIVAAEAVRYGRYFSHYCSVRPGITGLWQVSGRNDTSYRRRVALDVAYTKSQCAALNLRILASTLPSVVLRRGSY